MKDAPRDLTGRVAFVTGAARRLGRHLSIALAKAGADVVVHHKDSRDEAAAVAAEIRDLGRRAWTLRADFAETDEIRAMMSDVARDPGRLDIVINNVGNYIVKPIETSTEDEWRSTLDTNLIAPFTIIKEAIGLFPPSGGHVLNIGYAGLEQLTSNVHSTAYQVSKTGLYLLTKSFAQRLARRGVRVNMISPGHLENSVDLPKDIASSIPLGRAGTLDDIADAMLFFLRSDSYVTGVNLDVAGGYRLGLGEKFSAL